MPMWRTSSRTASRCASCNPGRNRPDRTARNERLIGASDRAFREEVIGDDCSEERVLVAALLERAHHTVERLVERGRDRIELRIGERLDGLDPALGRRTPPSRRAPPTRYAGVRPRPGSPGQAEGRSQERQAGTARADQRR